MTALNDSRLRSSEQTKEKLSDVYICVTGQERKNTQEQTSVPADQQSLGKLSATIHEAVLEGAQHFLDLLGAKRCTFQTFDDNARRKDAKLARILHGSLDTHADQLADLNRLGAGVFVAINQTDGQGRKRENIKRIRAVSADLDGVPLRPVRQCALKPHIIVESSPGRYHAYWRVKKFPIDHFEDAQRAIAKRFDGDPAVAKLTHIARLPGFNHCKGKPFRTHMIEVNDDLPVYTAEEILAEFPPEQQPHKPQVSLAGRIILPRDEPLTCASEFFNKKYRTPEGIASLLYYRGNFYSWRSTNYAEIDEQEGSQRTLCIFTGSDHRHP
jgi:hypothetical protein